METNQSVTTQNGNTAVAKPITLLNMLNREDVKKRFEEMLGKRAAGFISSIISATKANAELQNCSPDSVISAAVIAATLNLPIQNNLGFAALIPYKDGEASVAQFQMMWRGYVQLAMRTAQYLTINVSEVYEGELISENRITGVYVFDTSKKKSEKILGYVAYFKMINGFEKYFYWTVERITKHAKTYSQTFRSKKEWVVKNSRWTIDFDAMAKKTVLKLLLNRFGILSVDLEMALLTDQAAIKDADTIDIDYVDNKEDEPVDKQRERVELLLKDVVTIGELNSLASQIPPEYQELYEAKKKELEQPSKEPSPFTAEINHDIVICETVGQVNDLIAAHPELKDDKDFIAAANAQKIFIGKKLKGEKV